MGKIQIEAASLRESKVKHISIKLPLETLTKYLLQVAQQIQLRDQS